MRRCFPNSTRPIAGADGGARSTPSRFHDCSTPWIELPLSHLYPLPCRDAVGCCPTSRREPCRNAPIKSPTSAIGWQIYALTGSAYSLGLAGFDHRADGDGRHTISGIVRVALVRLGEFESSMTAALLGAMPVVVLDGVGTTDAG